MGYYKKSVDKYHGKLTTITLRIVKEDKELGIPDYRNTINDQAAKLGKSVNTYIMDLIENDIRTNKEGLKIEDFHIIRGMSEALKEDSKAD